MADKMKQAARELQRRTGMSYQAALNQLRKQKEELTKVERAIKLAK